ncbi:OB-fold putative lipoprotein [Akkermansiaceae bacterium]|nr:OB-fold putative lipoprotein [Akkermansiaceae bacterium]
MTAASIVGFVFLAIASVDDEGAAGGTEKVTNAEAVFNVTDKEIAKAFNENEVSANMTYENKVGTVTGKITGISKDFGVYSIMLDGGDWTGVACNFDGDVSKQLAPLKTGQRITIKGFCDGMYGNVVFENCVIVGSR